MSAAVLAPALTVAQARRAAADRLRESGFDTPDLDAYIVESGDPNGPYGAKEAGEGPLHPAIPAIANAIHDACGIRIRQLPFYPQRILRLLRERDARRAGKERVA